MFLVRLEFDPIAQSVDLLSNIAAQHYIISVNTRIHPGHLHIFGYVDLIQVYVYELKQTQMQISLNTCS